MNSVIHIKTNPSLSPKHIEFNKLVHSIEKLRMELTNEEKKLEIFSDYYIKNIIPVKAALCRSITIGQTYLVRGLVDEDKIRAQIQMNKKKAAPVKSRFQQRLEQMAKERGVQINQPKRK